MSWLRPVAVTPCMNPKCDRVGTVRLEVFGQLVGYACRVCSDAVDNYQQRTQT